ncbi:MAG TPA: HD domain-containing phosphohydrolase [Blastocatellia bacterium]|nr:HD domain-containing phosphohydrolase [Blastocatellia bacterium]
MGFTDRLSSDLKQYPASALLVLVSVSITGGGLLVIAAADVASVSDRLLATLILAFIVTLTSARHALSLRTAHIGISMADCVVYLAIVMFDPYCGALLAAVDAAVTSRRVKAKPALYSFNPANNAIAAYLAGRAYHSTSGYLSQDRVPTDAGQAILAFALPLVVLAATHYLLNVGLVDLMSHLTLRTKIADAFRKRFPWDPASHLASASAAGLVSYVASRFGMLMAIPAGVLALSVPVLIYYMVRTYRDKLDEQDRHYRELGEINDQILEMLAMAIDAKDQTTHDHIQRVKLFARRMGEKLGLSDAEIEAVKAGALLHDIGKIGVPAYILNKPGKLTEHEFEQMKMHTIIGADMLSNVNFRFPVVPIVRHHHERWDGRGYPDGLAGEEIPITARILTLVDNYDALRSDRPYHKAMTREETLEYIQRNAGTFFDPELVELFLSIVDDLEVEAAGFKSRAMKKHSGVGLAALKSAKPAAGLETAPKVDRAAAALNSIAETNQRVTELYEISRTLAGSFSLEDTTAILTNRLAKLIPFTTCALSLFDASRSEVDVVHAIGRDADAFLGRRQAVSAGITGWVIQNQRPMYNTNPLLDLGFLGPEKADLYKAVMVFPLLRNQEPLGAIALYSTEVKSYGAEYIQLMESIGQPVAHAIHNAMAFEQAQRTSVTDPVTGLSNMRGFAAHMEREQARSRRSGLPLSLVLVSAENLRETAAGRVATDEQVMASLAEMIRGKLRESDLMALQSTDTFVILLSESGPNETMDVLSRMREDLGQVSSAQTVLISLGASTSPDDGETLDSLIATARLRSTPAHDALAQLALVGPASLGTHRPS